MVASSDVYDVKILEKSQTYYDFSQESWHHYRSGDGVANGPHLVNQKMCNCVVQHILNYQCLTTSQITLLVLLFRKVTDFV